MAIAPKNLKGRKENKLKFDSIYNAMFSKSIYILCKWQNDSSKYVAEWTVEWMNKRLFDWVEVLRPVMHDIS